MKFVAALAAIALVPVAAVGGYLAHKDPKPPSFGVYMASHEGLKHVAGKDSDSWLAVAVTGPNKGGNMPVEQALSYYQTHAQLEASAQGKVKYVEVKCRRYSTSGRSGAVTDPLVVQRCQELPRSRKAVEKYMTDLLKPEPKS